MLSAPTMTAQRQERIPAVAPRNCLDRLAGGPVGRHLAGLAGFAGPGRHHRAGGGQPLLGLAIEGFDPVAYFVDARPMLGPAGFRGLARPARSGVSATRATAPPLSPIPKSTARSSAATTRSTWRAASPVAGNPRFWLISGAAALSVRPRGQPRRLCRRSRRASCGRRTRAGRSWSRALGAIAVSRAQRSAAAAGSPQAMNSGTMKSVAPARRTASRRPSRIGDLAAGGGDDRVAGRDIPFQVGARRG